MVAFLADVSRNGIPSRSEYSCDERSVDESDLCSVVLDHLLVDQVALVPDEELVDALVRVAVDLLQPLLDVVEGVLVGDVVDDDDAVRAPVVRGRDGPEPLLAGSVPLDVRRRVETHDLQLDGLALQLDGPYLEVDADRADVALRVRVVLE